MMKFALARFVVVVVVALLVFFLSLSHPSRPTTHQILNQRLSVEAKSRIGSLDNVKHKPGGGDKRVYNDVEYLRQMSEQGLGGTGSSSGQPSRSSSRRQSASHVSARLASKQGIDIFKRVTCNE